MAKKTTCDGTGVEIPDETPTTGFFGHQYCDEARSIAQKYLEEIDALHLECAIAFQLSLGRIRDSYREKLQQLPDDV